MDGVRSRGTAATTNARGATPANMSNRVLVEDGANLMKHMYLGNKLVMPVVVGG